MTDSKLDTALEAAFLNAGFGEIPDWGRHLADFIEFMHDQTETPHHYLLREYARILDSAAERVHILSGGHPT